MDSYARNHDAALKTKMYAQAKQSGKRPILTKTTRPQKLAEPMTGMVPKKES